MSVSSPFWAYHYQAGASASASVGARSFSLDTSRQFGVDDLLSSLSDLVPVVPLDAPTIMSIIMIAAFVIQFYWSLISWSLAQAAAASPSSSLATTTTTTTTSTTTAAPVRTPGAAVVLSTLRSQIVTPAPPPEWRNYIEDFDLPHWVGKRSPDLVKQSGIQYLKNWDTVVPKRFQEQVVGEHGSLRGQIQAVDTGHQDRRVSHEEAASTWYHHTSPRMSLHYGSNGGSDSWHTAGDLGHIEDLGELREFLGVPLSSHRLVNLPGEEQQVEETEEVKTAAGVAASILYNAERWGHRLEDWNLLSPDGAQLLTHTIIMMRCAVLSQDYCAKLDHYFRRQHNLNLVAAMMNHPQDDDDDDHDDHYYNHDYDGTDDYRDYSYHDWPPETGSTTSSAGVDRGPGRLYDVVMGDKERKSDTAQERLEQPTQQQTKQKKKQKQQDKNNRVRTGDLENSNENSSSNSTRRTWNIYVFMSVMAVLVFLMDASYRILRAVTTTTTTGRSASSHDDPHHNHLMATVSTALTRWDHLNGRTRL